MSDAAHLQWGAEALWQALEPLLPGLSVEVVARAESTNTQLLDRARLVGDGEAPGLSGRRAGDAAPCLLVAEHQTRGRGRFGRDWIACAGDSLTFSLALPLRPRDWSGLSLAVGVALAESLDVAEPPRIGLKWPNDLWLLDASAPGGGRKLGGILIETVAVGSRRMCIVGVGLNVLPQPAGDGYASGCGWLREIDADIDAPGALAAVAEPLVRAIQRFERDGFASFAAGWARRDLLRGRAVTTTAPQVADGVADGVDADGALRVRTADGTVALVSGEVSVRLQPAC